MLQQFDKRRILRFILRPLGRRFGTTRMGESTFWFLALEPGDDHGRLRIYQAKKPSFKAIAVDDGESGALGRKAGTA